MIELNLDNFPSLVKTSTIGLVTLDEMKAKQEVIVQEREKQLAKKQREKEREIEQELEAKRAEKRKQKQQIQTLSFQLDEEEEEEEEASPGNRRLLHLPKEPARRRRLCGTRKQDVVNE